jgi:DNA-binding NtrC family response regulator
MKMELLCVDDDANIRKAIGISLASPDRNITLAESAEEAIEFIKKKTFDLVITDLVMGRLGGIDVLRETKNVSPGTMVIILTGYADLSSAIDALRLHADDYLLKPCEDEEMSERVAKCLETAAIKKRVKVYEDMLAVCCRCKKIRDDEGQEKGGGTWMSVEEYMFKKARLRPTSTYCPVCAEEARAELDNKT